MKRSETGGRRGSAAQRVWWLAVAAMVGVAGVLVLRSQSGRLVPQAAAGPEQPPEKHVRPPARAGQFYPKGADELRRSVKGYLKKAAAEVPKELKKRRPIALISPHAGYSYSGQTAAFSYKLLEGKQRPSRVILLGPAHFVRLGAVASVAPYTHYRTPLGELAVDGEAREKLLRSPLFISEAAAHVPEHSLEVQLPFLQVLWEEPPKMLPILVGNVGDEEIAKMAEALAGVADENTLLVASSDFTHYGPAHRFAPFGRTGGKKLAAKIKELDMGAVRHIEKLDAEGLLGYCRETGATICGKRPVALMLKVLSGCEDVKGASLAYANSGDATGTYLNSVSYYAHGFYAPPETFKTPADEGAQDEEESGEPPDEGTE